MRDSLRRWLGVLLATLYQITAVAQNPAQQRTEPTQTGTEAQEMSGVDWFIALSSGFVFFMALVLLFIFTVRLGRRKTGDRSGRAS